MKHRNLFTPLIALTTLLLGLSFSGTALAESKFLTPKMSVDIPDLKFTEIVQEGTSLQINYLADYISAIYLWLIGSATLIAIVMIMIGGLQWTLSGGSVMGDGGKSSASAAKTRIKNAVIGLVLLMSTYMILFIVNPNLVKLAFPELEAIPLVDLPNESGTSIEDYEWAEATAVSNGAHGWNDVVMYNQQSYASTPYGVCGNVKTSGCGVASFAMAASYLSGTEVKPDAVAARFADEGYRVCAEGTEANPDGPCPTCQGTAAAAFFQSSYRSELGIEGSYIGHTQEAITTALDAGQLVIISYRTKGGGGHYVVITGYDEDGNVLVNNPWGGMKEKRSWSQITSTIKSATAIGKSS